ncbi:MAG: ketopantoate reductase family protein [Alphaproteobacteria bacterium]|nr:ketopantoate reductase family protein [Alphaproteobacteria bacterium]
MSNRKIAILGSGANGSSIGLDLTLAGLDVVLIDQWPAHVEAMRANGLTVRLEGKEMHAAVRPYHLCDLATFTHKFDIVLMLFKAYDSRWAARLIEPYLAADGLLVGAQNGMSAETIADIVGPSRTLGCVIEVASQLWEPGIVIRTTPHSGVGSSWFAVGSFHPSTAGREEEVASVLRHSGDVEISADILSSKWMKVVFNTMELTTAAMTGRPHGEAEGLPGMREIALAAGTEALAAGQARGHSIQPIVGLSRKEVENTNRLLEVMLDRLPLIARPGTWTTMHCDHAKGRLTETDDINGAVVATLAARGGAAPVNAAICEVMRRIHAGELKPDPANIGLVRELAARGGA